MDTGLGLRIKARRKELGMTQAELAKKLGYKTKSSITKIEQGVSDITQTQVRQFAEVLDCSVSYLMGWSADGSGGEDATKLNLYDRIRTECKNKGLSIRKLEQMTGLANGSISKWKTSEPSADSLQKVADVLEVTTEALRGEDPAKYFDRVAMAIQKAGNHEMRDYVLKTITDQVDVDLMPKEHYIDQDALELVEFLHKNPDYKVLFDAARTVNREDIQFVKDMIDRMRR